MTNTGTTLTRARTVLRIEADAIHRVADRLDDRFMTALDLLAACSGRVVVTGMGKSGIIARKIAATLSSIGTAAYFLHPAEAVHGDLGIIQPDDLLLIVSQSGETSEILRLLETLSRLGARLISITGAPESTLGTTADVTLDCHVDTEACPMNLAPTASTTAALALGDALAMTLLVKKGFQEEDFASLHPGGHLGKRLLQVSRLMHSGEELPTVPKSAGLAEVVAMISSKQLGMVCVTETDGTLAGVVTDGDLRRKLAEPEALTNQTAESLMTASPHTIEESVLAAHALNLMEGHRVTSLIVVDGNQLILGVVHLHDLWRTQLF